MREVIVYTNVHLRMWQEAYRDGVVEKSAFDSAWNTWSLLAQRALWAVGYDAELYVDPHAACEVYERDGLDESNPLGPEHADRVEAVLHSIGMEV